MSATRDVVKRAVAGLAIACLLLGGWTVREVVGGEAALRESDAALVRHSAYDAILHARRSARFYAPGAPHVEDAYRRLIALALAAEEHGERDLALFAWRSVRQAALDTRWIVTPHAADRDRAEREIARLVSVGAGERAGVDSDVEARQLALLRHDSNPRTAWVIVLVGGLATAGGAFSVAARRVAGPGRVEWRKGIRALTVAAFGIAAWVVAWWRA